MARLTSRYDRRKKRQNRIRKKITGSAEKPRLSIFRSARHIYVQAVNDLDGKTLAAASTSEKELGEKIKAYKGNCAAAAEVGKTIAERLKKIGITTAVFDRGGNRYHGRVKALGDAAREGGLQI